MDRKLVVEIERLTVNATRRREDLQASGLRKAKRRKLLTTVAGVLALLSAATIAAALTNLLGNAVFQLVAALIAGISGTISLLTAAYYTEDEIFTMLAGSTKYLMLRENVYRLVLEAWPGFVKNPPYLGLSR